MHATDRNFARKAATAARWAGKALWFVFGSIIRLLYVSIMTLSALASAMSGGEVRRSQDVTDDYLGLDPYGSTDMNHGSLKRENGK
ncbi:hypothetical protein QWI17_19205 [Gilvimarinus sp. SDUM040013]|uniref:DUF3742 domain-containing protein n=1 Tax=Gilvimarinus gilvus TaxID=3058038 RepID=A0ABU4S5Q8_9GAMM|nr:hypothetical protein [Gilvimarinus sp. SDUM040013]MDO3387981.1 hypothetical protein [Gilvimarinus sp. SDUM040013]MDX6851238.1 hypothetical protein [Gilvimarinus sp. SDUM040013]